MKKSKTVVIKILAVTLLCLQVVLLKFMIPKIFTPKTVEDGKIKMEDKGYSVNIITSDTDINFDDINDSKIVADIICTKLVDGRQITVTTIFCKDVDEAKEKCKMAKKENEDKINLKKKILKGTKSFYEKEAIDIEISNLKDFKVIRSGKIVIYGNKKAVNDYIGIYIKS